jgi:putative methionine-R-sulfoxide reductase with GAF domain
MRDYTRLARDLDLAPSLAGRGAGAIAGSQIDATRLQAMRKFVDAAWPALSPQSVSWIGFYFIGLGQDSMTLGPCRNKPACSPIGLHGVCGRGWLTRRSIVVRDVKVLGSDYVACDPRDQAELVIPLFDRGVCYGVLDVDSFDVGAFSEADAAALEPMLISMELTEPGRAAGGCITL